MTALSFEENQSFRQRWLWALMLAVLGGLLAALALAPEVQVALLIALGITLVTALFLWSLKLTVQVDAEAIHIRFFPVWKKTVPLAEVVRYEARTYRPILEYGGWGIRWGWKGTAYSVRGKQGVQLELANGSRIMIGSQRPEELATAIGQAKGQA